MIPVRDHNPSGRIPFVTYGLIAANTAVFLYSLSLGSGFDQFITHWAFVPSDISHGQHLITLLTAMFLHGGWLHLIGNMLFLNIFGDNLEDRFGHIRYLLFYLGAGLAGSLLQVLIGPGSTIPNLGASGAIAGVMGGYLFLFPRNPVDVWWGIGGMSSVPASAMLIYWIIYQFLFGFGSVGVDGGGVAYFAHIGGFAFGYLITRILTRLDQPGVRQLEPT